MNAAWCQIWHRRGEALIQRNKLTQGNDIIKAPVKTMFRASLSHHLTCHANWFAGSLPRWLTEKKSDQELRFYPCLLSETQEIAWLPTHFIQTRGCEWTPLPFSLYIWRIVGGRRPQECKCSDLWNKFKKKKCCLSYCLTFSCARKHPHRQKHPSHTLLSYYFYE